MPSNDSSPQLHERTLTGLAADIRARRVSPVELTEHLLARIERLDGRLHSYVTVTGGAALAQARQAERELARGGDRGPLHGIPVAVKDLCFTKGVRTTNGTTIHADFVPDVDGAVVQRLSGAGAVLLGKLALTEAADFFHHPELPRPVNPWRADLWPGVSSSGSGVATAAGLCVASIGSDTGGSIRFPCASNALTGVKPTWGRVSRYGSFERADSWDTLGPIARTAADAAAMLGVVAGRDDRDPTSLIAPVPAYVDRLRGVDGARGVRVGLDPTYGAAEIDPEVAAMIAAAAGVLAQLGARPRTIEIPDTAELYRHIVDLQSAEIAVAHRSDFPARAEDYGPWTRRGIEYGRGLAATELAAGTIARDRFRGAWHRVFDDVDMVLMPVSATPTPTDREAGERVERDVRAVMRFTGLASATGCPAVALPCGFTADGRPVGMQLVGPHLSEAELLTVAHAYQQVTDWHTRTPGDD